MGILYFVVTDVTGDNGSGVTTGVTSDGGSEVTTGKSHDQIHAGNIVIGSLQELLRLTISSFINYYTFK